MNGPRKIKSETGIAPTSNGKPDLSTAHLGCNQTGMILSYAERSYADQKGLTLLSRLRQHLPNGDYRETLPAQIMDCCNEIRRRAATEETARLEMSGSFNIGEQEIYFRALLLARKPSSDVTPVLILLSGTVLV